MLHQALTQLLVEFRVLRMGSEQRAVDCLGLGEFTSLHVHVRQIALRSRVVRCDLQPRLQLNCCLIVFLVGRQDSPELNMWLRFRGPLCDDLPQIVFRLRIALAAHIDVREADERIL